MSQSDTWPHTHNSRVSEPDSSNNLTIFRLFGSRQFSSKKLNESNTSLGVNTKMLLSGAFAGFSYTNVAFIFDLLKVRKQYHKTVPKSYAEEISYIYKTEGMRGFFNGYFGMLMRDVPGFAWYFMFYEWSRLKLGVTDTDKVTFAYQNKSKLEISLTTMLCGGVAAQTTWLICYPADLIKTRLQTAPTGCTKGFYTLAQEIYREHGILRMYRGIHI